MGSKTMSDRQNATKVLFFLFIIFTSSTPATYAQGPSSSTCEGEEVFHFLIPCGPYATGAAPFPPSEECCTEVNVLGNIVSYDSPQIRVFCRCYKEVAPSAGFKAELTQKVITECENAINLPLDPNIDCNSIPNMPTQNT
ncbi:hypothetical protein ACJRO7_003261 [Eucalyptus globulus]|uniref:Bifunctional inhibitor/plant lipid transfer protein/seed storage helical domain-containing protein n=1 Tax=Eucalyptus globulus TaxID=34317 RepID=A0ABD3IV44_EUCGL